MGLDTTHGCWHASYSGFAEWRNTIATLIGWNHEDTHFGTTSYAIPEDRIPNQPPPGVVTYTDDDEVYEVDYSKSYDNSAFLGEWHQDPDDVIDVLMIHSDCEGSIPHRFTRPLAERLSGILDTARLSKELGPGGEWSEDEWFREVTLQFITGLLAADALGEDVGFH